MFEYSISSFFRAPIRRSLRIAKLPLHNSTSQDLSKLNVSYYNYELRALETTNYKVDDTGSELSELDGKS